jgi:hypothetical protein
MPETLMTVASLGDTKGRLSVILSRMIQPEQPRSVLSVLGVLPNAFIHNERTLR